MLRKDKVEGWHHRSADDSLRSKQWRSCDRLKCGNRGTMGGRTIREEVRLYVEHNVLHYTQQMANVYFSPGLLRVRKNLEHNGKQLSILHNKWGVPYMALKRMWSIVHVEVKRWPKLFYAYEFPLVDGSNRPFPNLKTCPLHGRQHTCSFVLCIITWLPNRGKTRRQHSKKSETCWLHAIDRVAPRCETCRLNLPQRQPNNSQDALIELILLCYKFYKRGSILKTIYKMLGSLFTLLKFY